jgi:hypothetical protein
MLRWLRRRRQLLVVFLSGLLVPLIINLLSSWLEATVGPTPYRLAQILVVGVALVLLFGLAFVALGKEAPLQVVAEERRPPRYPGLIALVSKRLEGRTPAHEVAIRYHLDDQQERGEPLRVCWLVATEGAEGTVPEAQGMRRVYGARCRIIIRGLPGAFDARATFEQVRAIYQEAADPSIALLPEQIIADFTGGTSPMSAGMLLAAHDRGPMQYILGGTGPLASIPVLVEFRAAP